MLQLVSLPQPQTFECITERWDIQATSRFRHPSHFLDAAGNWKTEPASDVLVTDGVKMLFDPGHSEIVQSQFECQLRMDVATENIQLNSIATSPSTAMLCGGALLISRLS